MTVRSGIIAAMNPQRVIGAGGTLPWYYPADLMRFKRLTANTTIIMGRRTWESLPKKPLPKRRNIVITRQLFPRVETFTSIEKALKQAASKVWFIGGSHIFKEAMLYADEIDLTYVPDQVEATDLVFFPSLDPKIWQAEKRTPHADDPSLEHQRFLRRPGA